MGTKYQVYGLMVFVLAMLLLVFVLMMMASVLGLRAGYVMLRRSGLLQPSFSRWVERGRVGEILLSE